MYRKTPPNISQSAKGLFKLKHFVSVILVFWKNPGGSCSQSSRSCCGISWRVTAQEPLPWPSAQAFQQRLGQNVVLQSSDTFQKHRMITILAFYQAPEPRHLHFLWNTWFGTFSSLNTHLSYTFTSGGSETPAAFFFFKFFFFFN